MFLGWFGFDYLSVYRSLGTKSKANGHWALTVTDVLIPRLTSVSDVYLQGIDSYVNSRSKIMKFIFHEHYHQSSCICVVNECSTGWRDFYGGHSKKVHMSLMKIHLTRYY